MTGLTSAAIGIMAGAGFPITAMIAAFLLVATLVALRAVEKRWLEEHPD